VLQRPEIQRNSGKEPLDRAGVRCLPFARQNPSSSYQIKFKGPYMKLVKPIYDNIPIEFVSTPAK